MIRRGRLQGVPSDQSIPWDGLKPVPYVAEATSLKPEARSLKPIR